MQRPQTHRSAARIREDLDRINRPARDGQGGVTRLSFSPEHIQAVRYCLQECRSLGMRCYLDGMGNLIGRLEGRRPGLGALAFGSHLDSVREGGAYDGAGGVVVGLEALRLLAERGVAPRHPWQLFAFAEEEGVLFDTAMAGSGAFAGLFDGEAVQAWTTPEGVTLGELAAGFHREIAPLVDGPPPAEARSLAWYIEPHIEQGPVLDEEGARLGIVTSITGTTMTEVVFTGQANHAGTTPMHLRRDAVRGLVEVSRRLDEAVRAAEGAVGTVGKIAVTPNVGNVIAGEVRFTVDLRCTDGGLLTDLLEQLETWSTEAAERWGLQVALRPGHRVMPVAMDGRLRRGLHDAAGELGIEARALPSGAGHDALNMARLCPAGMLFVPSRDGKSHCPEEHSDVRDLAVAAEVLAGWIREEEENRAASRGEAAEDRPQGR